jgi:hypothetical protein
MNYMLWAFPFLINNDTKFYKDVTAPFVFADQSSVMASGAKQSGGFTVIST